VNILLRSFVRTVSRALLATSSLHAQSLVGAWTSGNTLTPDSSGTRAFVFLPNGTCFPIESENTADSANGKDGMERGTYTWNSGTGLFTLTSLAVNTNGRWGLSQGLGVGDSFTIDFSGNMAGDLTRVSAIPEPSTHAVLAGVGVFGLAAWRRRRVA
jgi:MYXO-CTERM domain-containing protein